MRRVLSLALAVLLMMTLIPASVFAAETITVTSDKSEVAAGDEFTLTVKLPDTGSLGGFQAFLNYDAEKVTFVSVQKGGLVTVTDDFIDLSNQKENNRVAALVSITDEDTWDFSKDLFTVTFKVNEGATGSVAPELEVVTYCSYDLMTDYEATVSMAEVAVAGGEEPAPTPAEETAVVTIDPASYTFAEDEAAKEIKITTNVTSGAAIAYQLGSEDVVYTSGSAVSFSLYTSGGAIYTTPGGISLGNSVVLKAWALINGVKSGEEATGNYDVKAKSSGGGGGGGGSATPAPQFPYTDVAENDYFRKPVEWALKKGVLSAEYPSKFNPTMGATRSDMVYYLWLAKGSPAPTTTEMPFTDVAASADYYNAVLWAYENGITAGVSATEFAPNQTVTRAQAITFLYGVAGRPAAGSEPFDDVNAEDYFAAPVAWAYGKGITAGTSANLFSPDRGCQRAQIITFMALYFAD